MNINIRLDKNFTTQYNKLQGEYGTEIAKINGFDDNQLSYTDFIDNFVDKKVVADASIDGNSNVSHKDIVTLEREMPKPHSKLLAFNKIYYEIQKKYGFKSANEWLRAEWVGELYMHDASSATFRPYCFAYDLKDLAEKGLFFIDGQGAEPAKHLTTFVTQCKEFVSWASNRTSGACGLPSFLVHAFYFWKHDIEDGYYLKNPEYYRDQCFQEFIFGLNQPYLRITQCAFTNISIMDRPYLEEIFGGREYPDGSLVIDYIDDIIEFQKAFMRVISKIRSEMMFTFPVLTYSLLYQNGKFVDEKFARWCSDHNTEWNDSNFFISDNVTALSSCCRLVNDFSKLDGFINSIGGTSLKIGSVKVNTINLRRIAIESGNNEEKYMELLEKRVRLCIEVLDVVRHIIVRDVEKGLLPNYTKGLIDIKNQYNTIGINGLYEVIRDFGYINQDSFGNKYYSEKGLDFATRILDRINEIKDSYTFDYSINVEAVPAERCAVILCQKDNALYGDKLKYQDFIYSNQWIPLMEKCSLDEKIKLGALLDKKCGGGQIAHINLETQLSKDNAWKMLNYIASKGVIYFAFNSKISVCKNSHGFVGSKVCPKCGNPEIDTYQRIVGYLVPSSNYSTARHKEFGKRYWFNLNDSIIDSTV